MKYDVGQGLMIIDWTSQANLGLLPLIYVVGCTRGRHAHAQRLVRCAPARDHLPSTLKCLSAVWGAVDLSLDRRDSTKLRFIF